jgi:uncharacterized protein (DUF58 family)
MNLTRRGYAALAVAAGAFLFAWAGDPDRARALNAIAAPVLAAVLAGAVTVRRADAPTVERTAPTRGFPRERRTVELTVDGDGVATITDGIGEGLSGSATFERTLPATVSYEVTYEERGVHSLGTTSVRVRDVLGLVEEQYQISDQTQVLVYPHVYTVANAGSVLRTLGPERNDRSEFDRLREYVPGDSLRDVHWKTSAKHDDLLVTEFTDPMDEAAVSLAASCAPGYADEMATAAATLFIAAVRAGLSADLGVPGGHLAQGHGETHKQHALELLARTGSGAVSEARWGDADVRIHAAASGTTVTIDDQIYSLEDLTAARENPVRTEVVA